MPDNTRVNSGKALKHIVKTKTVKAFSTAARAASAACALPQGLAAPPRRAVKGANGCGQKSNRTCPEGARPAAKRRDYLWRAISVRASR
jgi:hypothetical protein